MIGNLHRLDLRRTRQSSHSLKAFCQVHMKMKLVLVLLSFLAAVRAIDVQDCGSKLGSFSHVSITDCDGSDPVCILKRNTNVTINLQFTTNVDVQTVKADVHGIIQGLPVPFNIPNPDGCSKSGLICPLAKGTTDEYTATFPIMHSYPKIHVTVKWELKNEAGDDIVCLLIPAQIK